MASQDVPVPRKLSPMSAPAIQKSCDPRSTRDLKRKQESGFPATTADILSHLETIIEVQKRLATILHALCTLFENGARVRPEVKVVAREVLENGDQKIGSGIFDIKIVNSTAICFWVERVDGSEIDMISYHQCVEEKAAKECPDLLSNCDPALKLFSRL